MIQQQKITVFAAIFAFIGVVMGAFGTHNLRESLEINGMEHVWETGVFYHLIHATAAWATGFSLDSSGKFNRQAAAWWLAGVMFFSGSLYLLALGGPKWLGPVTPLGGLCFLMGWIFAARGAWAKAVSSPPP